MPALEWSTRHSVATNARRTAALINGLADPDVDGGSVARLLADHGEIGPIDLTGRDVAEMRAAAVRLRDVFEAEGIDAAAARLNRLLAATSGTIRLTSHGGATPWHPHLDSRDDAPMGEWFLASSCLALMALIWDRQQAPGGVCESTSCDNVFLTQNSGVPQRYCSRRCATRERVAAHRRAARGGALDSV